MENIYKMDGESINALILENQEKNSDDYVKRNRGYVTASMLKMFEKSPEAYFIKYILEMPLPSDDEEDSKALKLGTAVDDFISYWEMEFYNKYFIVPENFKVADKRQILEEMEMDTSGVDKVLEARIIWDRIKLTPGESKKLFGMLDEWKRQPLFDYDGDYKTQKVVTAKYKNLTIKATLDRLGIKKGLLRDMKSTNSLTKFIYQVTDYGYDFSMSFYNVLCKFAYEKDFTVILDACQSTAPYPSTSFVMPPESIANTARDRVIPVLEKLSKFTEKWEKTRDPKIWLEGKPFRDKTYDLDTYCKMETSLQTEFEYLQ